MLKHAHRWYWSDPLWECWTCAETRAWNSPQERDRLMREAVVARSGESSVPSPAPSEEPRR